MKYFSISIFFVLFRESLEVCIVCAVLLGFISRLPKTQQDSTKKLRLAVIYGTLSSAIIITSVGAAFVTVFHIYGKNLFSGAELLYEGIVGLLASLLIAFTSFAFLKGNKLYDNLHTKLERGIGMASHDDDTIKETPKSLESSNYTTAAKAFFWIPFITIMREGLETIMIIGGVSFSEDITSIPLAAIVGIIAGILAGILINRASGKLTLKSFFIAASYFLLLMAAGIMSRSVGLIQDHMWITATGLKDESSSAFDPRGNVWYLSCCSQKTDPSFGILYSILGYRNIATIGTIVCYCGFWMFISTVLLVLKVNQRRKEAQKKWKLAGLEMERSAEDILTV